MAQITFENKVALNENAGVADINKVKADDMNEIKGVVNENYTEQQVTNQQVANITGQILWTNSNPTSGFNSQNITLQNSDIDMIQIIFYQAINILRFQSTGLIPIGESHLSTMFNAKSYIRTFRIIDNVLTFDDCNTYNSYNSADSTVNNNAIIPLYVIGYKTGLIN